MKVEDLAIPTGDKSRIAHRVLRFAFGARCGGKKGQALVEMALIGTLLALLAAAAIDLGRAYYTAVVVTNMAGEGATYAAQNPEWDLASPSCSTAPFDTSKSIQDRVRQVAHERNLVIDRQDKLATTITITPDNCVSRCVGTPIKVTVTYTLDDLFLPGMLGQRNIVISRSSTQYVLNKANGAGCGS